MAAPGAIVISKMLYPHRRKLLIQMLRCLKKRLVRISLDAIANGTTEGLRRLAVNVGAMLTGICGIYCYAKWYFRLWVGDVTSIGGMNSWIAANIRLTKVCHLS